VQLEGLGKLKKSTSSGLEPSTFRLVEQCLNQLRYRIPPKNDVPYKIILSTPLFRLGSYIRLNTLFANSGKLCYSFSVADKFHYTELSTFAVMDGTSSADN
jgi:hypothetical protein